MHFRSLPSDQPLRLPIRHQMASRTPLSIEAILEKQRKEKEESSRVSTHFPPSLAPTDAPLSPAQVPDESGTSSDCVGEASCRSRSEQG